MLMNSVECAETAIVSGSTKYPLCNGTFHRCNIPCCARNAQRAIFKGPGNKYLFYWLPIEKWVIGDDFERPKGWLCSTSSKGFCPTAAKGWKEWNLSVGEFESVQTVRVREKVECASIVIVSQSSSNPACAGTYTKTSIQPSSQHAGRAILKGPGNKHMFYWSRIHKWVIGDDYNRAKGWYCSKHTEGWCPTDAPGWREWDHDTGKFKSAERLQVRTAEADIYVSDFDTTTPASSRGALEATDGRADMMLMDAPDIPISPAVSHARLPALQEDRGNASVHAPMHPKYYGGSHQQSMEQGIATLSVTNLRDDTGARQRLPPARASTQAATLSRSSHDDTSSRRLPHSRTQGAAVHRGFSPDDGTARNQRLPPAGSQQTRSAPTLQVHHHDHHREQEPRTSSKNSLPRLAPHASHMQQHDRVPSDVTPSNTIYLNDGVTYDSYEAHHYFQQHNTDEEHNPRLAQHQKRASMAVTFPPEDEIFDHEERKQREKEHRLKEQRQQRQSFAQQMRDIRHQVAPQMWSPPMSSESIQRISTTGHPISFEDDDIKQQGRQLFRETVRDVRRQTVMQSHQIQSYQIHAR